MHAITNHLPAYYAQQALNGATLACLYVTLASAYALLQGITNRIILSFGDFATFGAFTAVYVALWSMLDGEDGFAVMVIALAAAMIAAAGLGRFAHRAVFGPLLSSSNQVVMIVSIGVSILLQEILRLQSGGRDQWLPPLFDDSIPLRGPPFPVSLGWAQAAAIAVTISLIAALLAIMRYSAAGRLWRAVSQNARLAELSGVDTARVFQWSFVAASAMAAVAGWLVAVSYGGVSFAMGLTLGFKAMFAAIIGGFGKIGGAIVGGIFLALVETAWTTFFPMAYRDVAVFAIIIAVLILRPEGLLGDAWRRDSEA